MSLSSHINAPSPTLRHAPLSQVQSPRSHGEACSRIFFGMGAAPGWLWVMMARMWVWHPKPEAGAHGTGG